MKVSPARRALFAAILAIPGPALAADWGGIKDYRAMPGQPVPAPVPIPEFKPSWYFRLDAGLGVTSDPDVDGYVDDYLGAPGGPSGPDRIGGVSSWFDTDFDTSLTLGGGVGYYFGNGWRMDATIEKRSKDDIAIDAEGAWPGAYDQINSTTYGLVDGDASGRIQYLETAKLDGTLWFANLYYDFGTRFGLTPYVGAGIGFAWNEVARTAATAYSECADAVECAAGNYVHSRFASATDKADKVTLAAAAMAGLSYSVTEMTSVDIGYRYLYVQGTDTVLEFDDGSTSRLEIGDQHIHQVRAGLRFDVD